MIAASFIGLLNGMGRDRGPIFVLEQAILPSTVNATNRTAAFAWYNLLQDIALALGGLLAALPFFLRSISDIDVEWSFRLTLLLYAVLTMLSVPLYARLTSAVETAKTTARKRISKASRILLSKVCVVFGIDAISGGFVAASFISFFFYQRFGVSEGVVGVVFFCGRLANAFSQLAAAWLAKRIGLVNTMVFTHIPSSIFLVFSVFSPSFGWAVLFFMLREALVQMDVPTRQSYVMGMVQPEERTFASGVTHIVRLAGWAVAPVFAGLMMQKVSLATPLLIGACIKILYDVLLYVSFRNLRPPEEKAI
jgi:predicted MFS family arabinose efflux permease